MSVLPMLISRSKFLEVNGSLCKSEARTKLGETNWQKNTNINWIRFYRMTKCNELANYLISTLTSISDECLTIRNSFVIQETNCGSLMNCGALCDFVNLPLKMAIQKVTKYIVIKQSEWQESYRLISIRNL